MSQKTAKTSINVSINVKTALFFAASVLMIYASFVTLKNSNAATSAPSGVCGGVFTVRTAADGPLSNGQSATLNSGAFINFSNNTASFVGTKQTGQSGAQAQWSQQQMLNRPITVIPDPELSGSYQVTIETSSDLSIDLVFRLIPVNSGSTYLLQGKNVGGTGMCQKD